MSEQNLVLVRRYFAELLDQRRLELVDELFVPDLVFQPVGAPEAIRGREALRGFLLELGAAFPDARFTPGAAAAQGDTVAGEFTFTGTHLGEYHGLPPTGRPVRVEGVDLFRIADRRIARVRVHMDVFGLMLQLGAVPPPGALEANRRLVSRYLREVVSDGDLDAADRYVASGIVFTSPYTPEPIRGLAEFKAMIGGLHAAFPDLRLEEEAAVAEGDLVATRWRVHGTHTGPFGELPPSGRGFSITGMSFYRVVEGRIVEGWVDDDTLAMAEQLGAVAAPQPA